LPCSIASSAINDLARQIAALRAETGDAKGSQTGRFTALCLLSFFAAISSSS
jgi:hypothetical protein